MKKFGVMRFEPSFGLLKSSCPPTSPQETQTKLHTDHSGHRWPSYACWRVARKQGFVMVYKPRAKAVATRQTRYRKGERLGNGANGFRFKKMGRTFPQNHCQHHHPCPSFFPFAMLLFFGCLLGSSSVFLLFLGFTHIHVLYPTHPTHPLSGPLNAHVPSVFHAIVPKDLVKEDGERHKAGPPSPLSMGGVADPPRHRKLHQKNSCVLFGVGGWVGGWMKRRRMHGSLHGCESGWRVGE